MVERIEAERVRPPDETERRTEPLRREVAGPTDVPPDPDFVRYWEVSHQNGTYRPGAFDNGAVPPRWKEHWAANDKERYVHDDNRQARVEELYRAEGLSSNTLRAINDVDERGRSANCGECARAVAAALDGSPRAADALPDDGGESLDPMKTWADRDFTEPTEVRTGLGQLEQELVRQGPGAHAVVQVDWMTLREQYQRSGFTDEQIRAEEGVLGTELMDSREGHFFNAANVDGTVRYIDGQTGQMVDGRAGFVVDNVIADPAEPALRADGQEDIMGVNIDPLERVRAALGVPDPPDEMKFAPVARARGTTVVVFTGTDRRSYYVDGEGVVYRMPSSCGSPAAFERLDPSLLPGLRVG